MWMWRYIQYLAVAGYRQRIHYTMYVQQTVVRISIRTYIRSGFRDDFRVVFIFTLIFGSTERKTRPPIAALQICLEKINLIRQRPLIDGRETNANSKDSHFFLPFEKNNFSRHPFLYARYYRQRRRNNRKENVFLTLQRLTSFRSDDFERSTFHRAPIYSLVYTCTMLHIFSFFIFKKERRRKKLMMFREETYPSFPLGQHKIVLALYVRFIFVSL